MVNIQTRDRNNLFNILTKCKILKAPKINNKRITKNNHIDYFKIPNIIFQLLVQNIDIQADALC